MYHIIEKGILKEPKKLKKSENFYPGCRAGFALKDLGYLYDDERAAGKCRVLLVDLCLHFIVFLAACLDGSHTLDLVTSFDLRPPDIERDLGV